MRFLPSVRLGPSTLAGAAILASLQRVATGLTVDLVVTSAADGLHSGPQDPHPHGNAFDVRSHNLPPAQRQSVLRLVMGELAALTHDVGRSATLVETSGGLATECFFGFLEQPGAPNEHFHFQLRKGSNFAPMPRQESHDDRAESIR